MSKLLELGKAEVVHDGRFLQFIKRPFTNRLTGQSGHWEFVKRKTHGRIVAVVAITPEQEIVLTKIFRIPLDCYIIEPPAGLADQEGESELRLAERELLEETGYQCQNLHPIIEGPFNSGLNGDEIVFYLGENARKVAEPKLEAAEDIEVTLVPTHLLTDLLRRPPRGVKVDVKLWALLPFLA